MFKSLDIQKEMEVVGLDGKHVGTVDHLETADRIILSKNDPKAAGRHHLISIDWVDYVDQKVGLLQGLVVRTRVSLSMCWYRPFLARTIQTKIPTNCSDANK
jgi:hypothetical protein